MKTPRAYRDYYRVVDQWRAIVDRPISMEAKQAECMAVFHEFIGNIAWRRIRGTNRALRYYADMLVLREELRNTRMGGELGEFALIPAYRLVDDWLHQHSVA